MSSSRWKPSVTVAAVIERDGRFNKLAVDYKTLGEDYQKVYGMYTNLVAQVQAENEKNLKGSKKKSE